MATTTDMYNSFARWRHSRAALPLVHGRENGDGVGAGWQEALDGKRGASRPRGPRLFAGPPEGGGRGDQTRAIIDTPDMTGAPRYVVAYQLPRGMGAESPGGPTPPAKRRYGEPLVQAF